MTDQAVAALAPVLEATVIASPDVALFELGRIAAVRALLDEREAAVKAILRERWATQAGWEHVAGDVGKALLTKPRDAVRIADPAAFEAWVLRNRPHSAAVTERVDGDAIERYLVSDDPDAKLLADILADVPGALRHVTVIAEGLLDALRKEGRVAGGKLAVDDGVIVEGVTVGKASQPQLRATPDPKLVADLKGELAERVPPITAPEPEEGTDASET